MESNGRIMSQNKCFRFSLLLAADTAKFYLQFSDRSSHLESSLTFPPPEFEELVPFDENTNTVYCSQSDSLRLERVQKVKWSCF